MNAKEDENPHYLCTKNFQLKKKAHTHTL